MYLNKETNASYNFKAPKIEGDTDKKVEVVFPTSESVTATVSSNKATVKAERETTIIDLGTVSAAPTLTLTPGESLSPGAKAIVKVTNSSNASINVTVKEDESTTAGTFAVGASATVAKEIVWTGSEWILIG